ncbi:MAG: hypothetical protein IPF58_05530 [Saprospirales bacterium]|nr:hypothetical protein [Saprospirales bacterium]
MNRANSIKVGENILKMAFTHPIRDWFYHYTRVILSEHSRERLLLHIQSLVLSIHTSDPIGTLARDWEIGLIITHE